MHNNDYVICSCAQMPAFSQVTAYYTDQWPLRLTQTPGVSGCSEGLADGISPREVCSYTGHKQAESHHRKLNNTHGHLLDVVDSSKYFGKRGSRGGPRVRTPLRFVRGGVLCRGLMGRRGVQQFFHLIIINFFSGSLRSLVLYNHISTCIHTSKSNVHYGTVILSLYFPYPNHEKIPTSPSLSCFYQRTFSYLSSLEVHDFTPI